MEVGLIKKLRMSRNLHRRMKQLQNRTRTACWRLSFQEQQQHPLIVPIRLKWRGSPSILPTLDFPLGRCCRKEGRKRRVECEVV